jgi:hypothetical protein
MEPRVTVITISVTDLDRSLAFYRDGLEWPTEGIVGTEFEVGAVAFFPLNNGVQLAIYLRAQIAVIYLQRRNHPIFVDRPMCCLCRCEQFVDVVGLQDRSHRIGLIGYV